MSKKITFYFFVSIFLFFLGMGEVLSQPKPKEVEKDPQIRLGDVTFHIREIESTPSPIKMLEVHIEIINRSRQFVAPPNSIKVVVVPKEVKFPEATHVNGFALKPEEITLNVPLPPRTGRLLIFGLSLPEGKPESITFEIQINPPEGEKKVVTWEGR